MPDGRRHALAMASILALTLLLAACWWNPAVERRNELQPRATWAPAPLAPDAALAQTFTPTRDGLLGIELLAARYQPETPLPADYRICLRLEPADEPTSPPLTQCQPVTSLAHNAPLLLSFPEQRGVAGQRLRVVLWAEPAADVTLWASAEEAYADGALFVEGEPTAGDLRLALIQRYRLTDALTDLAAMAADWLWPLLCLALLLLGPGALLGLLLAGRRALAYAAPLSLAAWPLLLLWLDAFGLPFGRTVAWAASSGCGVGALAVLWRQKTLQLRLRAGLRRRETGILLLIALLSLAMRLLNVRELVAPNWVDALHHSEITQQIITLQGLPVDGGPFVELRGFYYHFGLHAIAAALAQMTALPAPQALLMVGQALLALAPVACYALARELTGRQLPALIAALVGGCWSYMPAYYASWGRYPQMAGLLILAGALPAIWALAAAPCADWKERLLAALLVSGLLLTHYRVAALLLPWLALALLRLAWRPSWSMLGAAGCAAALTLALAAPWLWRLLGPFASQFAEQYGSLAAPTSEVDAWPTNLLTYRRTPYLLGGALVGWVWAALRRRWPVARLGLWAGLCIIIPNLHWIGLPDVWLVNNTTVAISYWLPASVLLGYLLGEVARLARRCLQSRLPRSVRSACEAGAAAVLVALALWGSWLHLDVINASTVIVAQEDIEAAAWVREQLPADALVLVNSAHWSNTARRGTDGGWWLPLLADRRVTLPSLLYIQGVRAQYDQINALAIAVEQTADYCDAGFLARLYERGVTHVYIGARGGPLTPARLESCPAYALLYQHGPVRVYELASGGRESR